MIRFLGAVSDDERDAWLRRAHVFAMPSRMPAGGFAGEGFGIVYLEANAHGCPVVAGAVGGALDAVVRRADRAPGRPRGPRRVGNALVELLERQIAGAGAGADGRGGSGAGDGGDSPGR